MLLFCLFHQLSLSSKLFAIDFGSYYSKIGNISSLNHPQIITNRQTKRITPSFLAFRSSKKYDPSLKEPLNANEIMYLEPQIGNDALNILQKRSYAGSGFFSALIDATPEYAERLSKSLCVSNPYDIRFGFFNLTSSFLHFYVENVYGSIPEDKWELRFVVPNYYTIPQVNTIKAACSAAGIENATFIKDIDSIIYYCAEMKSHLFQERPQTFLIVDVGATSVKSYLIIFSMVKNIITATKASYYHNDQIGGAYATSKLVEYIKKQLGEKQYSLSSEIDIFELAEKAKHQLTLLKKVEVNVEFEDGENQTVTITRSTFEELIVDIVIDTVQVALSAGGKYSIDHVEVIGGSSRIPKIQQSLMKAFNVAKLGKSLNADEALTIGALSAELARQKNATIIIRDRLAKPTVDIDYGQGKMQVSNSSIAAFYFLVPQQPQEFTLQYSKKFFNKNLRTRKWSYRWECKNKSLSNLVFFDQSTIDISKVAEVIPKNDSVPRLSSENILKNWAENYTLNFNLSVSYVKSKEWKTKFVEILGRKYVSQKESAEIFNTLEELYYSMMKKNKIRPAYLKNFCSEDQENLRNIMENIKQSIIDRNEEVPIEKVEELLGSLKEFKYKAITAKRVEKDLEKINNTLTDLEKYTQKPLDQRHPKLSEFIDDVRNKINEIKIEFEQETTKKMELQNFDAINTKEIENSVNDKLAEVQKIERLHLESIPLVSIFVNRRPALINFINRHLWFFKLFEFE